VPPYNDDFDASKNFYKVLFRPGYSIQTRELTNLQSILQNQIESFGRNKFKQGDMVIPGEISFTNQVDYVKLSSVSEVATNVNGNIVFEKYNVKNLVGQVIQGLTSGVTATVVAAEVSNEFESDILFVTYTSSGNANNEKTFRQGETLEAPDISNSPTLVVGTDGSVLPISITRYDGETGEVYPPISSPAMGYASAVKIEEGVYFVNGYFVRNEKQILIVDKYYARPTAKVGFTISEQLVSPEEDVSLYDNARGFSNYSAPGAHRLKINLNLVSYDIETATDSNFIKLITVKNGSIQSIVKPTDYSLIEETLARRTYDESGDYVVDNFSIELREFYQKNGNKGLYPLNVTNNTVNGLSEKEASQKLVAGIGPGKAYVKGYEIVNKETKYITIDKARDTLEKNDNRIKVKNLPSYNITNVYSSISLNADGNEITSYPTIYLNTVFNDGSIGSNNTEVSSAYKQTIERRGQGFTTDDGVKTIYLQLGGGQTPPSSSNFPGITGNQVFGSDRKLWYIKTRVSGDALPTARSVEVLAANMTTRYDVNTDSSAQYVELTVLGNKYDLNQLFLEYDPEDIVNDPGTSQTRLTRRKLFLSESAAKANADYYGYIVDYNETITPVIGLAKPKNFVLSNIGSGFNSDTDKIISKGRLSGGTETYNSIFKLSYFNPVFFTKITVDSKITTGFTSGQYISGLTSGAYGVVENTQNGYYSPANSSVLFVRTLSGTFSSGETIIDEYGNSLRIARDNTISHFIVTARGTNYDTQTVIKVNGQTITSSVVSVKVDTANINALYSVEIKNKDLLSTEYLYPPTVTATYPGATGAVIIPVLYRNSVITYTDQDVKSFYSSFGTSYKFSADIETQTNGYYVNSQVTDFVFIGNAGNKYLECQGFSGDATLYLKQGDIVQFTDSTNTVVRSVVQYATKPQGLLRSRVYIDTSLKNSVSNNIVKLSAKINDVNSTLIIPTGSKYLDSLVKDPADSKIKYYFRRDFVITGTSGGGTVTFKAELPFGSQRFVPFTQENFLITVLSDGGSTTVDAGDILYIKPEWVEVQNSTDIAGLVAGTVLINIPQTYFGTVSNYTNLKLKLTATLEVNKATPRLKTLKENRRLLINSPGDKVVLIRGQNYDTGEPNELSYSDVIKINYVYEGTTTTAPTVDDAGNLVQGTDVGNRFTFDDGQRDTHYDVSRLVLKPGYDAPTGILLISFDYFDHSQGDFCTVDSYVHESGVMIGEVPSFNSSSLGKVSLRDVIDFRPKVDTTTSLSGFQNTSILAQSDYISFVGSGGITSSTPAADATLEYSIQFNSTQYLDRIDAVALNKKGEFLVKEGNSSLNPVKPDDIKDAITLYYLYVPSYTDSIDDVTITPVDNKRYTMKDIGKLEKRIERLEYYTQLSILEQQALNMQIKDEIGIDRFKTGFLVDGFENHGIGNLKSLDYKCAIDSQQSVLRAPAVESCFDLEEVYKNDVDRTNNGYRNSNGVVTLPYTDLTAFENVFATTTINPNPFVVLQYVGDSLLTPSVDQWFDDAEKPIILNNDSSMYSIFFVKPTAREALSSIFNSFTVNWVGTNRTFYNVTPLSTLSTSTASATVKLASIGSSSNISPQNNELAKGTSNTTVNGLNVVTSLQFYARSKPVLFKVSRMKPNTALYVFIDGTNVNRWIAPDYKFTGVAGNSISSFGSPLTTDSDGNASGLLLIPSGYPPVESSIWTGNVNDITYDTTTNQVNLVTGIKTVRFTSSSTDSKDSSVASYTEAKYYATGILPSLPPSIVSTVPPYFKANEGIQFVETNKTSDAGAASSPSPLTQTFKVEGYKGGLFLTGLDLFFSKKSANIPIRVYLTNVDSGKPGKYIIPGSEVVKSPNTYLKIYTNGVTYVTKGETVSGSVSGASGPVANIIDKNQNSLVPSTTGVYTLQNDQVYTLVLNNHNGKSFSQDELLTVPSLTTYNALNNTNLEVKIAKDSGRVTRLSVSNLGSNYETAKITIESPSLPGGATATATAFVSNGQVFDSTLTLSGSGYTSAPSVIITGTGSGNGGASILSELTIDTPAVRMGVAIDPTTSGSIVATTPTRFTFDYPVYLQNDTEYAFAVETDSVDYLIWTSQLGQIDKITNSIVTTQPLLGSVFKSQNVDNWTEDLFEDIKFKLYRAKFDTSITSNLYLTNSPLGYELLGTNAMETDASQDSTATSPLFKNNNKVIKVNHLNNGFESSGKSYVSFKNVQNFAGIDSSIINGKLFTVDNGGTDYYTISTNVRAGSSINGGGTVYGLYNRKYETLYAHIGFLNFSGTNITSFVKTTNIRPFDSNVTTYESYSQSDYEKTFLCEQHYFTNQKVLCSRINELKNSLSNGLVYKINLSSLSDNLSPLIDLRVSSIKISNNQIEKASGYEDRFGRRDQILEFYPVYKFQVDGLGGNIPTLGQTITGTTSKAQGIVVKWDSVNGKIFVKLTTDSIFIPGEGLQFSLQTTITAASVNILGLEEYNITFPINTTVVGLDSLNQPFTNKIEGRIKSWDSKKKILVVSNNKAPINDNYTSAASIGTSFARSSADTQVADIIRAGDILSYQGIVTGEEKFIEVKKVSYTTGEIYVSELTATNSSSIAKYCTKEVSLDTSSTTIDVRLTANTLNGDDILVYYKIKPSNSQFNFDDLNWYEFNPEGKSDVEVIPSADNAISGYFENQESYKEYKYSITNLPEFTSYAIKIVMRSSNPCYVPKIQDMRAVASF